MRWITTGSSIVARTGIRPPTVDTMAISNLRTKDRYPCRSHRGSSIV